MHWAMGWELQGEGLATQAWWQAPFMTGAGTCGLLREGDVLRLVRQTAAPPRLRSLRACTRPCSEIERGVHSLVSTVITRIGNFDLNFSMS